jgi:hypothetical protein
LTVAGFPWSAASGMTVKTSRFRWYFATLFGLELDRASYRAAFGVDVYDQFEGVFAALEEWGFVRITPPGSPWSTTVLSIHR